MKMDENHYDFPWRILAFLAQVVKIAVNSLDAVVSSESLDAGTMAASMSNSIQYSLSSSS